MPPPDPSLPSDVVPHGGIDSADNCHSSQDLNSRAALNSEQPNAGRVGRRCKWLPVADAHARAKYLTGAASESFGHVLVLSTGRFGAMSPRDPNGKRRPLGVVDTYHEANERLLRWQCTVSIAAFVAWLIELARPEPEGEG